MDSNLSLYHSLLDDLIAKSNGLLPREEIDETMTLASVAENVPKWQVLLTFSQVYFAYENEEEKNESKTTREGNART